jgi:CheY-like chemotaxis protein
LNQDGSIQDILVVDENQDEIIFIKNLLDGQGKYQVRVATSGVEGLVAMQAQLPQVLILNLLMPELSSSTFLESLFVDPAWREIPMILLSAGDVPEEQLARFSETSMKLLDKEGLKESELLESVENILNKIDTGKYGTGIPLLDGNA